jgi:amino-acid N-acetyltransferase
MDKRKLKEQVEIIRQAFGYINRFKGETFVIKLDGSLIMRNDFAILIKDLVLLHQLGIRIVLVPGAKKRIDEVLGTYNIKCRTVKGIRVSPPEAIQYIKMAAFDVCNRIMTSLAENNTNAIIGNWVKARAIGVRGGIDYQSSGCVEKLQTTLLRKTLDEGQVPIFPNIGWNARGKPYNISSNELALTISGELKAAKLFFITVSGGISAKKFKLPSGVYVSSDGVVPQLTVEEAGNMLDLNATPKHSEEMDLISLGYEACRSGVKRVHIVDGRTDGMVLKEIFSNRGFGTMIYANQHENIRPMAPQDSAEVMRIMEPSVEEDILVARSARELENHTDSFAVYEVDGTIHGCGALYTYPGKTGEIAGLAVDKSYNNLGTGKKIVTYLIEKASVLKLKKIIVLTTQTWDWFAELGFEPGSLEDIPAERRKRYSNKRKSRVLTYKISTRRANRRTIVD